MRILYAVEITECPWRHFSGGCGYAGCADYAKALSSTVCPTSGGCAPGGDKATAIINTIMGNAIDDRPSLRHRRVCAGGETAASGLTIRAFRPAPAAASIAGDTDHCACRPTASSWLGDCPHLSPRVSSDAIHIINGVLECRP